MRSFVRYFLVLLAVLTALTAYILVRYEMPYPAQPVPRFEAEIDITHRDEITARRPQIVFLGNSMVKDNVDTPALEKDVGRTIYTISYPDSGSAMWYLSIKNNIVTSPYKPKMLIILFHDTVLTTPDYKVDRKPYALDKLASSDEDFLIRLAYLNHMNPLEKIARRYLPVFDVGPQIQNYINSFIRYYPHRPFYNCGKRCVDLAYMNTFNNSAMDFPEATDLDSEERILYTKYSLDFPNRLKESFLPEIIHMCKVNNIHLILVRAKTNSFYNSVEPMGVSRYINNLSDYLAKNAVPFVDIQSDPRLNSKDFMDWFHVFPEARGTYTQMLADVLEPLLETGQ